MGMHAEAMDNLFVLSKQRADEQKTRDRHNSYEVRPDLEPTLSEKPQPRRSSLSRIGLKNDKDDVPEALSPAPVITLDVKPFGLSIKDAIYYRTRVPDKSVSTASTNTLEAFKVMHGFRKELSEQLFDRPSPLQSALLTPAGFRSRNELNDIASMALNLCPLLRKCDRTSLIEIAKVVHYYPVALKNSSIFSQFESPDSCCFVLSGKVVYSLETPFHDIKNYTIGELEHGSAIAAVDMLFMNADSNLTTVSNIQTELFKEYHTLIKEARESTAIPSPDLAAFLPPLFVSYTIAEPSEILSIKRSDFDRLVAPFAYTELKRTLNVIVASKVFDGWQYHELIRLARMGRIKSFKAGDIILEQGARPLFLYFIIGGVCKVSKRPNGSDILMRRLKDAKTRAEEFDLKYAYHHKLRNILSRAPEELIPPKLRGVHHLTRPELMREQLRSEILKLEAMISRKADEDNSSEGLLEICDLYWPRFFGESCVLDSTSTGVSLGRIHTETNCEILVIHQKQLQTFQIDDRTVLNLTKMGISYPDDDVLAKQQQTKREWRTLRASMVRDITKQADRSQEIGKSSRKFAI